jgi:hypothetical protein
MLRCELKMYAAAHAIAAGTSASRPKSSTAMIVQARGTLAAPANTAT